MKKAYIFLFFLSIVLSNCSENKKSLTVKRIALGNVKYGGVFRVNETEYFRSLYPQNITEVVGHRITNQIYEGLVTLNQADLSIKPCLAHSWEILDSAKLFVFHLRTDVFFQDDACFENNKGRRFTGKDVAYCLNRLCSPDVSNQGFWLFQDIVKGANFYHDSLSVEGRQNSNVDGIKIINDSTISIALNKPFASFLFRLAMPFTAIFPREAVDRYGADMRENTVGTGPFRLKKVLPDVGVFLVRNENYWGRDSLGNQLPYLDGVKISFIKEEKVEMLEFKKQNIELKYKLPMDMVNEIIDSSGELREGYKQFELQKVRELSSQYYGFLTVDELMKNVHVRRAFNYAIDRDKLVNYTLKGEGVANFYGIVPMGIPGFDHSQLKGYKFDPAQAQKEMALAGFPNGKGFPKITLQINSGGGRNEKVAEAVTTMLRDHLNVDVTIAQSLWAQHTENLESAKYQFWRLAWIADYPDAENFLNLFYGRHVPPKLTEKAYINSFRFKNATYDKLFEEALATEDFVKRSEKYIQLDQILIDEAPVLFLFYTQNKRLLQPYVRNLPANGMEYRNYREVWLDR